MSLVRSIAFYLPQFHPIPENDEWWGKGFTEWTNVVKAKPLFKGHYQPKLPTELGLYDLRVPEVREQQANLAKEYGIEGFCYWHYWFGNGRRILERPFNEVLDSGKPDFPFCLAWANETWTGIWHGLNNEILMEQTYPGRDDYLAHFHCLLKAFKDKRYMRVDDKPIFVVYRPKAIPDIKLFVDIFQEQAVQNGLKGVYLIATNVNTDWDAQANGFDAITPSNHDKLAYVRSESNVKNFYRRQLNRKRVSKVFKKIFKKPTHVYEYKEAMKWFVKDENSKSMIYPMVIPNWDNTARSGVNGFVLHNSTPDLFKQVMQKAINKVRDLPADKRIVFIKSWNEWAEGNYIEPDKKYGRKYLEVIKELIANNSSESPVK
ncbi:MAG: glycoside hydrolase family 99-like domain-containing protein [Chitinophagaceae bacterium]|nr:glycoside hydrolase family 99-like domain-containing protein [Chitinophagaceae bacterium]